MLVSITNYGPLRDSGILTINEDVWPCAGCFRSFPRTEKVLCDDCKQLLKEMEEDTRDSAIDFIMRIAFLLRLGSQGIELRDEKGRRIV